MGRPSEFTQEIADRICAGLMSGKSLRAVCADEDMPTRTTVFNWLAKKELTDFLDQYRNAREVQLEVQMDECVDIADDGVNDFVEVQKKNGAVVLCDREHITRSKLRVETRQWFAARLQPKKYGDKVEHTGANGGPIVFTVESL